MGIFLPPPSRKCTQLCGLDSIPPSRDSIINCVASISSTLFIMVHAMVLLPSLFLYLPSFPLHPSLPLSFGRVVCWHRMCCVPLIHWFLTSCHILHTYSPLFLRVFPLNEMHQSSIYIFPACNCLHLKLLNFIEFLLGCSGRCTDLASTGYVFVASEDLPESTMINPARELCSI